MQKKFHVIGTLRMILKGLWQKKNFMKLDGRIKPCSLDNGRSKQTEALNDYFSFM